MIELPITYIDKPAKLKPANRSGYWTVWPENPTDGPVVALSLFGHPIHGPYESAIPSFSAARRWPEHADIIISVPDSTD